METNIPPTSSHIVIVNGIKHEPGQSVFVQPDDEVETFEDDHFERFWKLFPRDKLRPGKKAGKSKCRQLWKKKRLGLRVDLVIAALKQDIAGIEKGVYEWAVNSTDRMCYFPGIQPWLNQDKWDRDIEQEMPKPKPPPVVESIPMTREEKARLLPGFRKLATRRSE